MRHLRGPEILARLPLAAVVLVFIQYRHGFDSIVRHHDNLDSVQAFYARVSLGQVFALPGLELPYLLGGVSRDQIGSELHLGMLLTVVLPLMWGMLVNELLMRALAFFGMRLLLVRLGFGDRPVIVYVVATLFSLQPFFLPGYGAVAGFPVLLAAFVSIYDKRALDRWSVLILVLTPLYAGAWVLIPYLVLLAVLTAGCALLLDRRAARPMALGIGILGAATAVADWRFVYLALTAEPTHRVEQVLPHRWDSGIWEGLGTTLLAEPDHAAMGKSSLLLAVLALGFVVLLAFPGFQRIRLRRAAALAWLSLPALVLIGRLWRPFQSTVMAEIFQDWSSVQLTRVRYAEPTIVYLLVAVSLAALGDLIARAGARWIRPAVLALGGVAVIVQGIALVDLHEFRQRPDALTVRQYYAPETFGEIRTAIAAGDGDLAVSVGLHPAIALYNGIDTADGYWVSYPLEYKYRFRRLIAPALELDDDDRRYFDTWGSRVYVFQPDLPRPSCCYALPQQPVDLVVDPDAFEELRITHVISSGPITNEDEVGLSLVLETGREHERGAIYLYEVVRT